MLSLVAITAAGTGKSGVATVPGAVIVHRAADTGTGDLGPATVATSDQAPETLRQWAVRMAASAPVLREEQVTVFRRLLVHQPVMSSAMVDEPGAVTPAA